MGKKWLSILSAIGVSLQSLAWIFMPISANAVEPLSIVISDLCEHGDGQGWCSTYFSGGLVDSNWADLALSGTTFTSWIQYVQFFFDAWTGAVELPQQGLPISGSVNWNIPVDFSGVPIGTTSGTLSVKFVGNDSTEIVSNPYPVTFDTSLPIPTATVNGDSLTGKIAMFWPDSNGWFFNTNLGGKRMAPPPTSPETAPQYLIDGTPATVSGACIDWTNGVTVGFWYSGWNDFVIGRSNYGGMCGRIRSFSGDVAIDGETHTLTIIAKDPYWNDLSPLDIRFGYDDSATGITLVDSQTPPPEADTTVPEIGSVSFVPNLAWTGADYSYSTSETATGMLYVGTNPSPELYELFGSGDEFRGTTGGTAHTGSLGGLEPGKRYYYFIRATDAALNSSSLTGSFLTASAVEIVQGNVVSTGATSFATGSVAVGESVSFSGTSASVVSDPVGANGFSGSLLISGIESVVASGATWNGSVIPPTLLGSSASERATVQKLSGLLPTNTDATTYSSNVLQTVKVGAAEPGVSLVASGGYFTVSFSVPSAGSGTVLKLFRSNDGNVWETNAPDTQCVLDSDRNCSFRTGHLSYFSPVAVVASAVPQPTPAPAQTTRGGGGGGGVVSTDYCPTGDKSDSYYDGKCDGNGVASTGSVATGTVSSGSVANTEPTETAETADAVKPKFADVSTNWAKSYIEKLASRGIVDDGVLFRPEDSITRAEFLKIVLGSAGKTVPKSTAPVFSDTAEDWQADIANYAKKLGIVSGQTIGGKSVFRPNDSITRSEAAKMLCGILGIQPSESVGAFADVPNASELSGYAESARENGIFDGQKIAGKLVFRPNDGITRAETAKAVSNAFGF